MKTKTSNPPTSEHPDTGAETARRWGMLAALAVATLNVAPAQARSEPLTPAQAPPCPMLMLLMDFECVQYQQRRGHAGSSEERSRIDQEFWQLGEERRRSCRCNTGGAVPVGRDAMSLDGLVCQ
jgi:hypothetical protein